MCGQYNPSSVTDREKPPVVVDVRATIDADPSRPQVLTEHVRSLLEEGAHYILLNVVNLTYADSLVLGAVMQAYASAIRRGATLKLVNTSRRFRELLAITKIDRIIETVEAETSGPPPHESERM
jgi:anti-anti-sigma factor